MASNLGPQPRGRRQSSPAPPNTSRITRSQSTAPHKNVRDRRHEASHRNNQDVEDVIHVSSTQDDISSSQAMQPMQAIPQAKTNTNTKTLALLVSQQQEVIQLLQKERAEAKKEHQELTKLVKHLVEQVEKLKNELQPQTATNQSQPPSWASVVARGVPQAPPAYNRQSSNNPTTMLIDVPPTAPTRLQPMASPGTYLPQQQ
ncbi:hypothetical protein B0J12DRAFT_723764 [Macrophomina phaseolina]|uniref:Uncharacterized protein n=1 Tax=Macrophomina phaseolina TaxID=35725 RepID=A0ABQ8GRX8_9PEZI|nr:hypothetical protein B0J12DRAFT_723764 [Macrophomina phaseolina]